MISYADANASPKGEEVVDMQQMKAELCDRVFVESDISCTCILLKIIAFSSLELSS